MKTFRELKVWQKSHQLVLNIYRLTRDFPQDEKFVLTSQMRRATVSIPANIAEGFKRKTQRDFGHFLNIAEGSLEETKYYLILAKDLGYANMGDYQKSTDQTDEVGRMLQGLYKKVI